MPTSKQDIFITGGILSVLGLYVLAFSHDLQAGFFLLGLGVVFMASSSKEFREKVFNFFFSIFEELWKLLTSHAWIWVKEFIREERQR